MKTITENNGKPYDNQEQRIKDKFINGAEKMNFKTTDFVQVYHNELRPDGEPFGYWRNALYVIKDNNNHIVIYTNGEKEVLSNQAQIRKYIIDDNYGWENKNKCK